MRRRIVTAALGLGLLVVATSAFAQQVAGKVLNRDGVPQAQCQLSFTGHEVNYTAWTNSEGVFYLENPRHGDYHVTVRQGDKYEEFRNEEFPNVSIDSGGLHPSTLVVSW